MASPDSSPSLPPIAPLSEELTESRKELSSKIQGLKQDLQSWRSKMDTQAKVYQTELLELKKSLNVEVDQLRSEFQELRTTLKQQQEDVIASLKNLDHILYRQKEQFSDGVGYSWIDGLKAHVELHVNDKMMLNVHKSSHTIHLSQFTKEACYYRMIFERFFLQNSAILTVPGGASIACSTAKVVK